MTEFEKQEILAKAKIWFQESVANNHIKNTEKLVDPNKFNINPFLAVYLANFLTGNSEPESIAKALVYPRVLGTSVTTTFGSATQKFTSTVLSGYGSTTSGIDIEFIDQVDGRKKYCQIKSGPNTINVDDITTIKDHFNGVLNLARRNNLTIGLNDLVVGVLYGERDELSSRYLAIDKQYPVIIGKDFWYRLTGEENFYFELAQAIGEVAIQADFSSELEDVIHELATHQEIINLSRK